MQVKSLQSLVVLLISYQQDHIDPKDEINQHINQLTHRVLTDSFAAQIYDPNPDTPRLFPNIGEALETLERQGKISE